MSTNQNNSNPPNKSSGTFTINTNGTAASNGFINVTIGPGAWSSYNPWGYVPTLQDDPEENKDNRDGCVCKSCKEFYQFAEINQPDKTFVCWKCRNGL